MTQPSPKDGGKQLAPKTLAPSVRRRISTLLTVLQGVRRRLWTRRTLERGSSVLLLSGVLAAVAVVLLRAAWLSRSHDEVLSWVAIASALLAALWVLVHRVPWSTAAFLLDSESLGHDRGATALELAARDDRGAWARLQADDTERWVRDIRPRDVVPRIRPALGPAAILAVGLLVACWSLPLNWLDGSALTSARQPADGIQVALPSPGDQLAQIPEMLGDDERELIRDDIALLDAVERQVSDEATQNWLKEVRETLKGVEQGTLGKYDALARLNALHTRAPQGADGALPLERGSQAVPPTSDPSKRADPSVRPEDSDRRQHQTDRAIRSELVDAVRESVKSAPAGVMRKAIEKAADSQDLNAISKWIEKLAQKRWSDRELERWIKVAEKFADQLNKAKVPKKFEALARRVRRLQEKRRQKGGLTTAERRRLRSTRRDLQRLRRSHGDMEGAKYRLQRLARMSRHAAEEMRRSKRSRLNRNKSKDRVKRAQDEARRRRAFRRQMRQAARGLRREGQRQRSRRAQRIGRARLRDLRDAINRSANRNAAKKDFERRARSQRAAAEARARAKRKQDQGAGDRRQQAKAAGRRASEHRAKARKSSEAGAGGGGKRRSGMRLGEGDGSPDGRMRMMREQARGGVGEHPGGDGVGQGSGGQGTQRRHRRARVARTERVAGVHGEGPTVKRVFLDAARKGFAKKGWRKVYADYSEVAEEMLDKESLPAGRRAIVRRYFELIRPRVRSREEQR